MNMTKLYGQVKFMYRQVEI